MGQGILLIGGSDSAALEWGTQDSAWLMSEMLWMLLLWLQQDTKDWGPSAHFIHALKGYVLKSSHTCQASRQERPLAAGLVLTDSFHFLLR